MSANVTRNVIKMEALDQSCRACLRKLDDKFYCLDRIDQQDGISLMKKLSACIPEMNLDDWNTFICFSCTSMLRLAYEFRKICLATETHIQSTNQNSISDSKILIPEEVIVKTELDIPNESKLDQVKVEEIDLDEDEDTWLRANGYFNNNSSDTDDLFEETDTAESDIIEGIGQTSLSHHLANEPDIESIIRTSCENIEFLKERHITPENLKCYVTIDKLPENYSHVANEDMIVENVEPVKMCSSNQCPNYRHVHQCKICCKNYYSELSLLQHMKKHDVSPAVACPNCEQIFNTRKGYEHHLTYYSKKTCFECKLHFLSKEDLSNHEQEHRKRDAVEETKNELTKKELNHMVYVTDSTSEEQFRRIIVSEDVFEKAVKSFSNELSDDNPPIIEKYCCSWNCNCENKNSNAGESTDSADELAYVSLLKKVRDDFALASNSVRKCKEVAKKNITMISSVRKYRRWVSNTQNSANSTVVLEHSYCKHAKEQKKKKIKMRRRRKKKRNTFKKSTTILENSCNVSAEEHHENSGLQEVGYSETINTSSANVAIDNIINEPVNNSSLVLPVLYTESNNANSKKSKIEKSVPVNHLNVKSIAKADKICVQQQEKLSSETNMVCLNTHNNETSNTYDKSNLQKPTFTESIDIRNMSLADLLKDTVNVDCRIQQGQPSQIVTLEDLLSCLDGPPTSVHAVAPPDGTITNYISQNSTELTKNLKKIVTNINDSTQSVSCKKQRPKILKGATNKTLTDNLSSSPSVSAVIPIKHINNLKRAALETSKINGKRLCEKIDKINSEKNKVLDIIKTTNNVDKTQATINESKRIDTLSNNQQMISGMVPTTYLSSISTSNSFLTSSPIYSNPATVATNSQDSSYKNSVFNELYGSEYLKFLNRFLKTIKLVTSLEKRSCNGNSNSIADGESCEGTNLEYNLEPANNSTKGFNLDDNSCKIVQTNTLSSKSDSMVNLRYTNNFPPIQPTISGRSSNVFQFQASEDIIKEIETSSDPFPKTNVINITTRESFPKENYSHGYTILKVGKPLFPNTVKYTSKLNIDSTNKSIFNSNTNEDLVTPNAEPANHQNELMLFPGTLKYANRRNCGVTFKPTARANNLSIINAKPLNHQRESTLFPTTVKYRDRRKSAGIDKPFVNANEDKIIITTVQPANHKEILTVFPPPTLKYIDKRNGNSTGKPIVSSNDDVAIINASSSNYQRELTLCPNSANCCVNTNSGSTDKPIANADDVLVTINAQSANHQRESTELPTTLKCTDNKRTKDNSDKSTIRTNNDFTRHSVLESDDIIDCNSRNDDGLEKAGKIVDLTTNIDTFSINFNYIRDQTEGCLQNASQNKTCVNHGNRLKPFVKEVCTVTSTQSNAEQDEQENFHGNANQILPVANKAFVSEINQQNVKVPETLHNEAPNVVCFESVSNDGRNKLFVDSSQKTLHEMTFEKNSNIETKASQSSDIISLTKRNYNSEIKKLFNLTFKPPPSLAKNQKNYVQNKKIDNIEICTNNSESQSLDDKILLNGQENNRDLINNESKTENSVSKTPDEPRPNEKNEAYNKIHNETQLDSNLTSNSSGRVENTAAEDLINSSQLENSSFNEKSELLNENENEMVFNSDQGPLTSNKNFHATKYNLSNCSANANYSTSITIRNDIKIQNTIKNQENIEPNLNEIFVPSLHTDIGFDATEYFSPAADKFSEKNVTTSIELFDNGKTIERSNDVSISENKSSNQKDEKYEPIVLTESDNVAQQRDSKIKCLFNIDFERFHSQLNANESKKLRRSTNLISKRRYRKKKRNRNRKKNKKEFKSEHAQEKSLFKEVGLELVKEALNKTLLQNIPEGNKSDQINTADCSSTTKKKARLFKCNTCRKYFDNSFQRELHQCQIFLAHSAKVTLKDSFCEKCEKVFSNDKFKNMHICEISKPSSKNGWKESVKWVCTVCNRNFTRGRLLDLHLKNAHKNPEGVLTENITPSAVQKCLICKKFIKDGIFRFLHLVRHFSFRKHRCKKNKGVSQKQTEYKRKSEKVRKYRLSEIVDIFQVRGDKIMNNCKTLQKKTLSKILKKILNYLHFVKCRKCNKVSGGWFNETLQSYFIKWGYLHRKLIKGKCTTMKRNLVRNASFKSGRSFDFRRIITAKKVDENRIKTKYAKRKINSPLVKRVINKQMLIRKQMLRVMSDLGLSAKEMNSCTSDALKIESSKNKIKCSFHKSTEDKKQMYSDNTAVVQFSENTNQRLYQLLTEKGNTSKRIINVNDKKEIVIEENVEKRPLKPISKEHTCKYCLLKFSSKVVFKMHKDTVTHKRNVALLQRSENEIEKELWKSVDKPQTLKDVQNAVQSIMNKIKMIKKYHCDFCSDSFISKNQLEMHRKIHVYEFFE